MFMVLSSWQSHCESSPGSVDECRTAPSGRRPSTKPYDLGCESACTGCQNLHPPSPFIYPARKLIHIYRPTEGRRLSRPSWLITYRYGLPVHRRSPIRNYVDRGQRVTTKPNCQPVLLQIYFNICVPKMKYNLVSQSYCRNAKIMRFVFFTIQCSFFRTKLMAIFRRIRPPNGGVECRWGVKNRDFLPSRFIMEMIQDKAIVAT